MAPMHIRLPEGQVTILPGALTHYLLAGPMYLHHDVSSVEVPDRSLQGFSRVHLKPGETKTVVFSLKQSQLAVWNTRHEWTVEPGPYTVFAGSSSQTSLSAGFSMPATGTP